ncbi:MAG: hypothetical protein RBG13Loki_3481 [Promethearchaeota archaeon CR_4]|nr:MAG: hypothetical protein RBG13Loki_3481 [Candidatus Lokiarchaeota archaeon CR_4]
MVLKQEYAVDIPPIKPTGAPKEEILGQQIKSIARQMREVMQTKREIGDLLRRLAQCLDLGWLMQYENCMFGEPAFLNQVQPIDLSGLKVAAVDGGLARHSLMSADFLFIRAIGVIFSFQGTNPPLVKYYPHENNNYIFSIFQTPLSSHKLEVRSSIERARLEIKLAREILDKFSPIEMMILDGSICMEPVDVLFASNDEVMHYYQSLLDDYAKLYQACQNHNVLLVGCVKDSRSAKLCQLLCEILPMLIKRNPKLRELTSINYKQYLQIFRDVDLFNQILRSGERTAAFRSFPTAQESRFSNMMHTVKDFLNENVPIDFFAYYLKPVQHDAPMRVEFFARANTNEVAKKADLIARMLLPMSSGHDGFAAPVPQIEADLRARLDPTEIDLFVNELMREIGWDLSLGFLRKRRDRRPF